MPTRELAACSSPCECIGTLPLQASACDERGRRFESRGRRRAELARAVGVFGLWCKGRRTGRWFERGLSPVYCRMQPPRCSLAGRGCATSPACCSSHAPCPGLPECKGARLSVWLAIRAQCNDALRRLPRARLANRSPPLVSLVSGGAPLSAARACGNIWLWAVLCAQTGRAGESAQCHRKGGPGSAHLPWGQRLTGQKHGGTLEVMIV